MTNRELFTLLGEPMTEATETLFKTLDKEPEVALRFACDCAEHALQRERDADREPHEALWEAIAIARDQPFTRAARKASRAAWAVADAAGDAAEGAMTVPTTATWGGVPVEAWRVSTIANQAAIWDAGRSAALAATSASLATRRRVHTAKRTTRIAWTAKQAADAARRNAAERATNRALIAAATEIVAKSAAAGNAAAGYVIAESTAEQAATGADRHEVWESLAAAWKEVDATNAIEVATSSASAASDVEQEWQKERLLTLLRQG